MWRFIQGVDRTQSTLFPAQLDEYIAEDNCARVVDVFIDTPNFKALGFDGAIPANTGRLSYRVLLFLSGSRTSGARGMHRSLKDWPSQTLV
jgi:hypothetical protein